MIRESYNKAVLEMNAIACEAENWQQSAELWMNRALAAEKLLREICALDSNHAHSDTAGIKHWRTAITRARDLYLRIDGKLIAAEESREEQINNGQFGVGA